jgi:small GTP-binding protein
MVGMFATGKTSLVRRFVHSLYSDKYHSTVGVKVDRKAITVSGEEVNLLLWDLEGKDELRDVRASYLRGSAGIFFAADGTRRETVDAIFELQDLTRATVGDVPAILAMNKIDLSDAWTADESDYARLRDTGLDPIFSSAKTGEGVEEAFARLAGLLLAPPI